MQALPPLIAARWLATATLLALGRDPLVRDRMVHQWLTVPLVLAAIGLMVVGRTLHPIAEGPWAAWLGFLVGWSLLALVGVRSGWSARLPDPSLLGVQVALGMVSAAWAYVLVGPQRPLVIPVMLVILIYSMFQLSARTAQWLGVWSVVTLGVACAFVVRVWPGHTQALPDLLNWLVLAVCMAAVTLLTMQAARIRQRLQDQGEALNKAFEHIERLATHDELTGLFNRRHGGELMRLALARHRRSGVHLCVALLDIDHFKRFNDEHGHALGDTVLRAFAEACRAALRGTDVMVRWGGEEFLVLMQGSEAQAALAAVERLRDAVRQVSVRGPAGQGLNFTFSAGIGQAQADSEFGPLLERADAALYRAKAAGRDRVELEAAR